MQELLLWVSDVAQCINFERLIGPAWRTPWYSVYTAALSQLYIRYFLESTRALHLPLHSITTLQRKSRYAGVPSNGTLRMEAACPETLENPHSPCVRHMLGAFQRSIIGVPRKVLALKHASSYSRIRFLYSPLDHNQRSIRLIHILPRLSDEGLIQCKISHGSTRSSYICLSYVWDYPPRTSNATDECPNANSRVILIERRPFLIRENLFDFLCMARSRCKNKSAAEHASTFTLPLWIDALCIDQSSRDERNHQVAQMGHIYSQAMSVEVWLGRFAMHSFPIAQRIDVGAAEVKALQVRIETIWKQWISCGTPEETSRIWTQSQHFWYDRLFFKSIFQNKYWERAWIVQEIVLAREVTLWLGNMLVDMKFIREVAEYLMETAWWQKVMEKGAGSDQMQYLDYHRYQSSHDFTSGQRIDLIVLLDLFSNKQCANPQDRIYSLLSLCPPEKGILPVDYGMPLGRIAQEFFKHYPRALCICSAVIVARALQLADHTSENELPHNLRGTQIEFDMAQENVSFPEWQHCKTFGDGGCNHRLLGGVPESVNFGAICESFGWHRFTSGLNDAPTRALTESLKYSLWVNKPRSRLSMRHDRRESRYTVRIALWMFGRLTPQRIRLCSKVKQRICHKHASIITYGTLVRHSSSLPVREMQRSRASILSELLFDSTNKSPLFPVQTIDPEKTAIDDDVAVQGYGSELEKTLGGLQS